MNNVKQHGWVRLWVKYGRGHTHVEDRWIWCEDIAEDLKEEAEEFGRQRCSHVERYEYGYDDLVAIPPPDVVKRLRVKYKEQIESAQAMLARLPVDPSSP